MRKLHGGLVAALAIAVIGAIAGTNAQSATPYKLGMFEQNGRQFVGMVLQNDTVVIDLSRANVGAPATLKQLIAGGTPGPAPATPPWPQRRPPSRRRSRCRSNRSRRCRRFPIRSVLAQCRGQLQRTWHRDDRPGTTAAASAAKVDPKVAQGIPWYWKRKPGDPRQNPYYF